MTKAFLPFILGLLTAAALAQQPLRLHPKNPHYFEFRGKPTVLITSAEHYGAVLNPDFEFKTYLDELARHGLNYTRIFSGSYVEAPGLGDFSIPSNTLGPKPERFLAPWARTDQPGYHRGGNKFDLARWDPAYFSRLKSFVQEAGKRGIVVEMTLFTSHYSEDGWLSSPLHPKNNVNRVDSVAKNDALTLKNGNLLHFQEALVRKLVRELNPYDNVFFEIQNEPWADKGVKVKSGLRHTDPVAAGAESWHEVIELANPDRLAWQQRVASFIKSEESNLPKKHLIAQNISNFYYPIAEPDPQVSIFHFHYALPQAASDNQNINRVIGLDETGFNGTSDSVYRRQAWRFLLAGGGLFNNLDYSFAVGHERGDFDNPKAPGGGSAALRAQLKVLKNFLQSVNFLQMKPLENGVQNLPEGSRAYGLVAPGKQAALFFEGNKPASGQITLTPGPWREEWVDVLTGQELQQRTTAHTGGPYKLTGPKGEVALRLTRLAK
jgi:hypothetical protein